MAPDSRPTRPSVPRRFLVWFAGFLLTGYLNHGLTETDLRATSPAQVASSLVALVVSVAGIGYFLLVVPRSIQETYLLPLVVLVIVLGAAPIAVQWVGVKAAEFRQGPSTPAPESSVLSRPFVWLAGLLLTGRVFHGLTATDLRELSTREWARGFGSIAVVCAGVGYVAFVVPRDIAVLLLSVAGGLVGLRAVMMVAHSVVVRLIELRMTIST